MKPEAKINKHTKKTLQKAQEKHPDSKLCNCTNKKQCPLNGQCLTKSIVYQINITANIPGYKRNITLVYHKGHLEFNNGNHKKFFAKQHPKNATLSKEDQKVKQQNGIPVIK